MRVMGGVCRGEWMWASEKKKSKRRRLDKKESAESVKWRLVERGEGVPESAFLGVAADLTCFVARRKVRVWGLLRSLLSIRRRRRCV